MSNSKLKSAGRIPKPSILLADHAQHFFWAVIDLAEKKLLRLCIERLLGLGGCSGTARRPFHWFDIFIFYRRFFRQDFSAEHCSQPPAGL